MAKEGYLIIGYAGLYFKNPVDWFNSKYCDRQHRQELVRTLVPTLGIAIAKARARELQLASSTTKVVLFIGDTPLWELDWKQMLKEEPEVGNAKG